MLSSTTAHLFPERSHPGPFRPRLASFGGGRYSPE